MKTTFAFGLLWVALACGFMFLGCETDSANSAVQVEPSSTTIRSGQSRSFTASGGYDYQWTLSRDDLGTLSTRTGPTTVYTSRADGTVTNETVVLRVLSTIDGQATGTSTSDVSTNSTSTGPYQASGQAFITHI